MQITFTPMRSDMVLRLERLGETLRVNGRILDFTALAEGASLPVAGFDCPLLAADVTRANGVVQVTLILPHAADAPEDERRQRVLQVSADGPVALPD